MENLKRLQKISTLWRDKATIFDLFGRGFISKHDVDELITKEEPSTIDSEKSDLQLFIRDFWEAIVDHERQFRESA
jgi:hypothetical protein